MKSVCVYLGANPGKGELFTETAISLGQSIAKRRIKLIYGGSSCGLMGILANEVVSCGGQVLGIISKKILDIEAPLDTIDQLIVTETMQERRLLLQKHADAFIVMPGGLGTLEEAFETWNSIKLGIIKKPIGFLNPNHYYDGLFSFMTHCEQEGLVLTKHLQIPLIETDPERLLNELAQQALTQQEVLAL